MFVVFSLQNVHRVVFCLQNVLTVSRFMSVFLFTECTHEHFSLYRMYSWSFCLYRMYSWSFCLYRMYSWSFSLHEIHSWPFFLNEIHSKSVSSLQNTPMAVLSLQNTLMAVFSLHNSLMAVFSLHNSLVVVFSAQNTLMAARMRSSTTARGRYDTRGSKMVLLPDLVTSDVDSWLRARLDFRQSASNVSVRSAVYTSDTEPPGGVQFCKLLSPYRALEWIYVDSLRPQGQSTSVLDLIG